MMVCWLGLPKLREAGAKVLKNVLDMKKWGVILGRGFADIAVMFGWDRPGGRCPSRNRLKWKEKGGKVLTFDTVTSLNASSTKSSLSGASLRINISHMVRQTIALV